MKVIKINPKDNVCVCLDLVRKGEMLDISSSEKVVANEDIDRGHKIALSDIKTGEAIIKYGFQIGVATSDIKKGNFVHSHNVKTALSENTNFNYAPSEKPSTEIKKSDLTFQGYIRENGTVGTRNEIWIIPTVGCVNKVAEKLANENQHLVKENVEALISISHPYGCSQLGDDHETTKKILASLTKNPNCGAALIVSLGCENLTHEQFEVALGDYDKNKIKFLCSQESKNELTDGKKILEELFAFANKYKRQPVSIDKLVVGMKCGGSDGLSGITANPLVGRFTDFLCETGGTAILTEVPEMFGAEQILFNRCKDKSTFDKALNMVNNFKDYFVAHGQVVYENPSPGNKKGGITTLEEKSCGCVQKGGSATITDVLLYGDHIKTKGLNLLTGPGNDIVSTTALTAAGATLIMFTTGRGTPLGSLVPTIKLSTNTALSISKPNWIDFNAGKIAEGMDIDELNKEFIKYVIEVASGKKTNNEINSYRDIAIFKDGVTL